MLQLTEVSLRRGARLLFAGVSFQVHAGQRVGVTGANGSGKSSLFELILGQLECDAGTVELPPSHRVAHVAQASPDSQRSALDFVIDGDAELRELETDLERLDPAKASDRWHQAQERLIAIGGYSAAARAAQLLHGLGFAPETLQQPVTDFSGGWRMRLSLAQALMCRSDLLLLDEPTNHLDLPAILWLEDWLRRYEGMLLLISHDRDFLDGICNRIALIERQRIELFTGNYSQFEMLRSERLAQQQAMYEQQQREIRHVQSFIERFRYKASKARQAQSRIRMLERMQRIAPAHVDSPFHFSFLEPEKQPAFLLKLDSVEAGYRAREPVLRDVNLLVSAGERIGLLGVNGAGKSTLVKALADGSTVLTGERIVHRDTRVGYFAQHQLEQLDPALSPMDHLRALHPQDREQDLRTFLGHFGFGGERIFDPVAPFSGGEKSRLVLALLIRQRPNLVLLDEPTNHLDLDMRQALAMALNDYSGALVVISHDRALLRSVCEELVIVHDGVVEPFDQALDDYAMWLAERQSTPSPVSAAAEPPVRPSRREQRQANARMRERLLPLSRRVGAVELRLEQVRNELAVLERELADERLYRDAGRKDQLAQLGLRQAECQRELQRLEDEWLEASTELEAANRTGA